MLKNLKALTQAAKQSALAGLFGDSTNEKTLKINSDKNHPIADNLNSQPKSEPSLISLSNLDDLTGTSTLKLNTQTATDEFLELFANKIEPLKSQDEYNDRNVEHQIQSNTISSINSDLIDFRTMKRNYESEMSLLIKNSTITSSEFFDSLDKSLLADSSLVSSKRSSGSDSDKSIELSDQMNLLSLSHACNDQNLTSKFSVK